MASVLKSIVVMLGRLTRSALIIGASALLALPTWAAGDLCEEAFSAQEVSEASPGSVPSISTAFSILAYENNLIQQRDERLKRKGLVVDNGGLCSSTCGVNILQAVALYAYPNAHDYIYRNSDKLIARVVDVASKKYNLDAKLGLSSDQLAVALTEVSKGLGIKLHTDVVTAGERFNKELNTDGFSESDLETDENTIALISIQTRDSAHALVLAGYDRETKKAYFNDPESPSTMQEATVSFSKFKGSPTLKLNRIGYGNEPHVGTIFRILYVSIAPIPERPQRERSLELQAQPTPERSTKPASNQRVADYLKYVGKRVLIRTRDGQDQKMIVTSVGNASKPEKLQLLPTISGFESTFGGRHSSQVDLDNISSVTEIPVPKNLSRYKSLTGKTVSVRFENYKFRDGDYEVAGYENANFSKFFPNGGLWLRSVQDESNSFLVPFDVIVSLKQR